jgi:hypothetical protein
VSRKANIRTPYACNNKCFYLNACEDIPQKTKIIVAAISQPGEKNYQNHSFLLTLPSLLAKNSSKTIKNAKLVVWTLNKSRN